jgi:hypothetical protein
MPAINNMKMISFIFIPILTGAFALFCAGLVANACVDWYKISGFEGKAGYFIVIVAIFGGFAGLVIGGVTAWIISSGVSPGFFKGLGISWGIVTVTSLLAALFS